MVNSATFTLFAGLVAVAQAFTKADTSADPSGNPIITPATGGSVEAGKEFDITWTATSAGTVTIYLCKGPSTNCVNEDTPLADQVENDGSFSWTVSTALEASTTTGFGYGIQLISDTDNKVYQYSGQFGIINQDVTSSSSVVISSASASASSSAASVYSSAASAIATASGSVSAASANVTVAAVTASASVGTITGKATGGANSTIIQPTGPLTVPTSLRTTASATGATKTTASTTTTTSVPTGAAGMVKVGLGAMFGGVVAALAL